ncbi:MAG: translation initiation factor IF-2 [Armatimonadota bacterium]|nr:translation initiation factor IF-2 [Armatimonadota bacterium]
MRVYELAKELGLTAKELMDVLASLKVPVKSHSSSLTVVQEERVRAHIVATRPKGKKAAAAPAPAPPPPPAPAGPPRPESKTPTGERILGVRKILIPPPPAQVPAPAAPGTAAPSLQAAPPAAPAEAAPPRVIPRPAAPAQAAPTPVAPAAPAPAASAAPAAPPVEVPKAPRAPTRPAPEEPAGVRIEPVRPPRREGPREVPREVVPPAGPLLPVPEKPVPPRAQPPERRRAPEGKPAGRPQVQPRRPTLRPIRRRRPAVRRAEPAPVEVAPQVASEIELSGPIAVGELAARLQAPAGEVVRRLLDRGVLAGINQQVPLELAAAVAESFGTVVRRMPSEAAEAPARKMERLTVAAGAGAPPRPPVVTVMGHVDHGKTSLLDAIRQTRVAEAEVGGITQHIGASVVEWGGRKIVFIDTPGHEAFTTLRARGAQVTDIAVLVVAADDGVMPQTVEAVNHARAAGVPIVVALNKVDLPQANLDRVKQQLADLGLVPEEWGGDTIVVPVSARQRTGLEHLLEMILLVADLQDLRAEEDRPARGTIIEARLDRGRGPVATVLVQEGTLRVGDAVVAGETYGRVRAMMDARGERRVQAGPSVPVEVLGLVDVPVAGDLLEVVRDERMARAVADERRERRRAAEQAAARPAGVEAAGEEGPKELRLVLKADTHGSIEALTGALPKLTTPEVKISILHAGVGNVSESDIMLAAASRAIVIGFNVRPEAHVRQVAESERVDVRLHRIIYEVLDDLAQLQKGLVAPKTQEVVLGQAEVRRVFVISRLGAVAGSYVTGGRIVRGAMARLIRDGAVVYEGRIASLRRFKEDVREVAEGFECGIALERFNDIKERDVIEAYEVQQVSA